MIKFIANNSITYLYYKYNWISNSMYLWLYWNSNLYGNPSLSSNFKLLKKKYLLV